MSKVDNVLKILGEEVSYEDERMDIFELRYYEKNPRVLSKLIREQEIDSLSDDRIQKVVERRMKDEQSVRNLRKTIRHHRGIVEPLVVQFSTRKVIEGNSRLAALRMLYAENSDPVYLTVPCRMVTLSEKQIDALLHQYHVDGKTEWTPFDKAHFSYHRILVEKISIEDHAEVTSTSQAEIRKRIDTVQLMKEQKMEDKTDRFSYYDQIVRSTKLKPILIDHKVRQYLLNEVKAKKPEFTAQEMRDHIPEIAKKPKLLKKLIGGNCTFEDARVEAKVSQPKQHLAKALGSLREIRKRDIDSLDKNDRNSLRSEARKCQREVKRIQGILSEESG